MTRFAIFDVEGDGLHPTKIHCLSFYSSQDGSFTLTDYDDMRRFFTAYDVYIGHNIILWDVPQLERLLNIKIEGTLIDTLPVSWYLFPDRKNHGLEDWGIDVGVEKPKIDSWDDLPIEEYVNRCESDVEITKKVWNKELKLLNELYKDPDLFWKFLRYLAFKMDCIREQEEGGFDLDVEYCEKSLATLEALRDEKVKILESGMPKVPKTVTRRRPKIMYKKDGTPSTHGEKWLELLADNGFNDDYDGELEVTVGYDEPNSGSHDQIKQWLYSLGWVPRTFKHDIDKDGRPKQIPQVNLPHGAGLCESIKELYEIEPHLEELDGYYVIRHRITVLKGFLRDQEGGKLRGRVAGLTNTLRFKHAELVNLPKADKPYGEMMRGSLVAPPGMVLCGADMASLEDRLKQHFIYPYDPEYVEEMSKPGFDPHLDIAVLGNMMTAEEAEAYKKGDKSKKKIRDMAKNTNYAGQYGAGAAKIALTGNIPLETAIDLHTTYWERNHAIKKVSSDQKVEYTKDGSMWLVNPINGFRYSLRNKKDIFSTLVQGTASYAFDVWLGYLRGAGIRILGQFHDEKISRNRPEENEEISHIHQKALDDTNSVLKLNRELGIDIQFGTRYSEIH